MIERWNEFKFHKTRNFQTPTIFKSPILTRISNKNYISKLSDPKLPNKLEKYD